MSVSAVADIIPQLVETHRRWGRWLSEDRTHTRCAIIDPMLWALGWRTWEPSQCRPNIRVRGGGYVDYLMYDPNGQIAVSIVIGGPAHKRKDDRQRMARLLTGMIHGVAALTNGVHWEIYDLAHPHRRFASKMVESFTLDTSDPVELEDTSQALDYWLGNHGDRHHSRPTES